MGEPGEALEQAGDQDATIVGGALPEVSFASGRYTVRRVLPQGGQKRVFVVRDTALDRDCVLSLIKAEQLETDEIARFRREAQTMARLGAHPHVVTIFDFGDDAGRPYIVCEYVTGGDLRDLLRATGGPLPVPRALEIAEGIAEGVVHAHAMGVIHRDLKPANVWMDARGRAKLGDFGLAMRLDESSLTDTTSFMGSAAYMAPEQALGAAADERTDLYGLGATLYELLTGRPPFLGADPLSVISQAINTPPAPPSWHNPAVPRALDTFVMRLLSKAPEDRMSDAASCVTELRSMLTSLDAPETTTAESALVGELQGIAWGRFVGRRREMDQLRAALDKALSGEGGTVMLAGEPGIGKSRLAEEFLVYARLRGASVATGRCFDSESFVPYRPFVDALRQCVEKLDDDELRAKLGHGASDIALLLRELPQRLPDIEPAPPLEGDAERLRLFESVTNFVRALTAEHPLVILLDDLHWADTPSLLLMQYLARRIGANRVLLIGTYRDTDLDRRHALHRILADLRKDAAYTRILLRGLPTEDVAALLNATVESGDRGRQRLTNALVEQTEGNPFFIREILSHLVEDGRIYREADGGWNSKITDTLALGVPEGLREVIGLRLSRLSPECGEILAVASLARAGFNWSELLAICGDRDGTLVDLIEESLNAQLIFERKSGRDVAYDFTHALIRSTLSDELSTPRRMMLHKRIGEALEGLYTADIDDHVEQLAHHFYHAAPTGETQRAIGYVLRAGERAFDVLAWEEAAAQYERALELLDLQPAPSEEQRCDVLLDLGEAYARAGDAPSMRATFERAAANARKRGDATQLTRAALGFGRGEDDFVRDDPTLISLLREALGALGDDQPALRAMVAARLGAATLMDKDPAPAMSLIKEAISSARQADDPRTLVLALNAMHEALFSPEDFEERKSIGAEASLLADGIADKVAAWYSHDWRLTDLLESGDVAAADLEIERLSKIAAELRQPLWNALTVVARINRLLFSGSYEAAEQQIIETRETAERLQAPALLFYCQWQLFWLRTQQGRIAEMDGFAREWAADASNLGRYARIVAVRAMEMGDREGAREAFERVAVDNFGGLRFDHTWIHTVALITEVCAFLKDEARASVLYDRLLPYAGRNVVGGDIICLGAVSRYLGLLAATMQRWEAAEQHLQDGLEMNLRMGARPYVARTQYEYARTLCDRGSGREQALDLLAQSSRIAAELHMRALLDQTTELRTQLLNLA